MPTSDTHTYTKTEQPQILLPLLIHALYNHWKSQANKQIHVCPLLYTEDTEPGYQPLTKHSYRAWNFTVL